ncbi:unnamed protein product [Brassicogethes aeneus]|uniref:Uncharacterized protein n=1 Tax=Brassicogethes aeneus TaxID=1431903 RepID=A0A9P0AV18_BRAAE|nr:unnamed protein product [Brassicogethes aeneus]
MKHCLIFLVCFFVGVLAQENFKDAFSALTPEQGAKCLTASGVDMKEIESIKDKMENPSENLLCFAKCMAEEAKYINPDGTVNHEELKKISSYNPCMANIERISSCSDIQAFEKCTS